METTNSNVRYTKKKEKKIKKSKNRETVTEYVFIVLRE